MTFDAVHHSLLYPADVLRQPSLHRATPSEADLGLAPIIRALNYDGHHARLVSGLLAELSPDADSIHYRQEVLDDLLRASALAASIEATLPSLRALAEPKPFQHVGDLTPLLQVGAQLAELDAYVTCVEQLFAALDQAGGELRSDGLHGLRDLLATIRADSTYLQLQTELPTLRAQLDQAGSITLGINLDAQLRPESATILSVSEQRFAGKAALFQRLFGARAESEVVQGISALRRATEGQRSTPENELFQDLSRLIERVATPVAAALGRYAHINAAQIIPFEAEFAFYIGAVKLTTLIRAAGLPLCRPEIVPIDQQVCYIEQNYSLDLALRLRLVPEKELASAIVTNDVCFDQQAKISILTGPNSGGKTTYIRAIGQAQVLFQAGLLVPGVNARMSPVDSIFTHFATIERLDRDGGRLSEELEQLARIFATASVNSLVLLNEPLTSTDHHTARIIAIDVLAGLHALGVRVVLVTHLYELVTDSSAHAPTTWDAIVSLIAVAEQQPTTSAHQPTYKIKRGYPQILSLARTLAQHYGLEYAQIKATLRSRGFEDQ